MNRQVNDDNNSDNSTKDNDCFISSLLSHSCAKFVNERRDHLYIADKRAN